MKILAIEKELQPVNWKNETQILVEEAKAAYKLILAGTLREIYFSEYKNAILILECEDKIAAKQLLSELPLAKKGLIDFEITELHPYTGFTRLMDLE